MFNEWYLRDCSRKQKLAYQVRGNSGKPTTAHAIYGYRKDPEDKHHWLVDETAAAVVRRIFRLTIEGHGPGEIATILREEKIERPYFYMAKQKMLNSQSPAALEHPYDWNFATVADILSKPEYIGHTVNFRTRKESYKDKYAVKLPQEDWLIFENTHEAIIAPETWELVQQIRKTKRRTDTTGEANPLTGLVFCADCGAKLYNHRGRYSNGKRQECDPETGLYPADHYECSSFCRTVHRADKMCFSHYIGTKALRSLILDTIRTASTYAIENEDSFIARVREASEIRQKEAAKDLRRKLNRDKKRASELDILIRKLYESYALEQITESRFTTLLAGYEQEQAEVKESVARGETELEAFNADSERIEQFIALAKKYTDFSVLTTPMIFEFIDKIIVHAAYKDEYGDRCQEVEIYLKFIGKLDIPVPEPTPEELAEQEKLRKKRMYYRERNERQKERKRQEAIAAAQAAQ